MPGGRIDPLLFSSMEAIAEQAAEKAVCKTMIAIGIDASDPLKAQRDFALWREMGELALSAEFRKDIEHTRKWRKAIESVEAKGTLTIIGLLTAGVAAALWVGLQDILKR
jgi:hypothetical protein